VKKNTNLVIYSLYQEDVLLCKSVIYPYLKVKSVVALETSGRYIM